MAKGARASTKKANNARLKVGVFGPVESARNERLSAKLLELASQPKPKKDEVVMDIEDATDATDENNAAPVSENKPTQDMEVDSGAAATSAQSKPGKNRIEKKRSSRKASIVFPKYKKVPKGGKSKGKK